MIMGIYELITTDANSKFNLSSKTGCNGFQRNRSKRAFSFLSSFSSANRKHHLTTLGPKKVMSQTGYNNLFFSQASERPES